MALPPLDAAHNASSPAGPDTQDTWGAATVDDATASAGDLGATDGAPLFRSATEAAALLDQAFQSDLFQDGYEASPLYGSPFDGAAPPIENRPAEPSAIGSEPPSTDAAPIQADGDWTPMTHDDAALDRALDTLSQLLESS
ncbi:MAG: hypothetical protein AAF772_01275 [Acidobacteriota bacterium]